MPGSFNPYAVLGLSHSASEEEIRKVYRKQEMQYHPDKNGNATAEMKAFASELMKVFKRAGDVLTKDSESKKGVAKQTGNSVNSINNVKIMTNVQRPSAIYGRLFTELTRQFTLKPLKNLSNEDRSKAYSELKDLAKSESFGKKYYQHLYRVEGDSLEYPDVYQFISHLSEWAEPAGQLNPEIFKEHLTPLKAMKILQIFIRGKYYGDNLSTIKNYLSAEIARFEGLTSPVSTLYKSIASIVNAASISKDYQQILNALQGIYAFYYCEGYSESANNELIQIMKDKHFRFFVASAHSYLWSAGDRVFNNGLLLQLKSEQSATRNACQRLKKIIPLGYYPPPIEEKMLSIFSGKQISVEELYECAHLFIDIAASDRTSIGVVNSLILAAVCYQLASLKETAKAPGMAAEFFAFGLYQKAMRNAFYSTPVVTVYAATHIAKFMSELVYDQTSISLETLSQFISQPGSAELMIHPRSVEKTIFGAIKKALYMLDIFPFYTSPKSTRDLQIIQEYQLGIMRSLLSSLLRNKSVADMCEYSKVAYHAYEDALTKWSKQQNEAERLEKQAELKVKAIELLLEKDSILPSRMKKLIDQPYIHMGRNRDGWLVANSELDFPDKSNIALYKSFDGYEIDYETGSIKLLFKPWQQEDSRSLRLFSDFDILQMINLGIGGGFISLEHLDADKRYHPLQAVRLSPD